jgi:hypothetical protein
MVVTGTYLALLILFLIGFLFKTIIQFTNEKIIKKMLQEELLSEATLKLKNTLLEKYSHNLFYETMKQTEAIEYNWSEALDLTGIGIEELSESEVIKMKNKERFIYDINLNQLKNFILKKNKTSGIIYYNKLKIGDVTSEYNNYIWQKDNANTPKEKNFLKKQVILRKLSESKKERETVRIYFDHKLEELIKNNDHRNLEGLLDSYYELYKLQMVNSDQ